MDEATLGSLVEALEATPGNTALRIVVIRGLYAAGDPRAAEYVDRLVPTALSPLDRAFVSGVLLRAGEVARALAFGGGDEPEVQIARAGVARPG